MAKRSAPEEVATGAIAKELERAADYLPVDSDGAARAAAMIAECF